MSLEPKRDQRFLVLLGFVLLVLTFVPRGYSPFLRIILTFRNNESYELFKLLFDIFDIIISITVIVSGYMFGRRVDLSRNYRKYINCLLISWVLAAVFFGVLYFFTEDMTKAVYQNTLIQSTTGYNVLAPFFSGMTLGWLVKDRPSIQTTWNKSILNYVLILQGVNLVISMGSSYFQKVFLYSGRSIAAYGLYSQVSSFAYFLVSLWFMWKMYQAGKTVELDREYGSILFTLWAPRVAVLVIQSLIIWYVQQYSRVDWFFHLAERILLSPIRAFGLHFALLCLGYIHSRYMFVEKLKIREK